MGNKFIRWFSLLGLLLYFVAAVGAVMLVAERSAAAKEWAGESQLKVRTMEAEEAQAKALQDIAATLKELRKGCPQ